MCIRDRNISSGTIAAARVPTLNQDTSGTAEKATRVIVTASSDTTAFPLFVQAATGNLTPHAQTNFTFNATSGVLSCTGFSGAGTSLTALNASNLGSGTVPTARLGSGTASSSNFLRGDGSWQTIATDKIEEGNTSVEAIDTGSDGHIKLATEGTERVRVGTAGEIGLSGANYGNAGQVLTSGGSGSAPQWSSPAGGVSITALLKLTNL